MVGHLTGGQEVAGSSPAAPTNYDFAGLRPAAPRRLGVLRSPFSSPPSSSQSICPCSDRRSMADVLLGRELDAAKRRHMLAGLVLN